MWKAQTGYNSKQANKERTGKKKERNHNECHADRTGRCTTGSETDVFQGRQVLRTYLTTQLFRKEKIHREVEQLVSSSRKSVKDHHHNRDVARAEGRKTSQYTTHLGPDGFKTKKQNQKQSTTRISYTIRPSRQALLHQTQKQAPFLGLCNRLQARSPVATPALFPVQDLAPHRP